MLTFAVFLPSLRGEFLNWDDDANFVHNTRYRGLAPENLKWMFTDSFGHYMPITWLTLGLDYVLWGMNPGGYHATSMFLHAVASALVFLFLQALIARRRPELPARATDSSAAAGALFFSIHPLRVESVAWITERRDVTAGLFFALTLWAYVRMSGEAPGSRSRRNWLILAALSFSAMVFSKSMGMTLPLVLLVLDAFALRRLASEKAGALLKEKIPFFALMIAAVAVTAVTQTRADAIYSRSDYPLLQSIAQPGYRVSFYVLKTFWPFQLSPLYWYRPQIGLPQALGWFLVVAVSAFVFIRRRAAPEVLACWISYLVLIAPVAGIFQAGPHFAADRYSYFACLPFAVLAAGVLASVPASLRSPALLSASALLLAFAFLTSRQCLVWKDSVSLWTRAIELDPSVYFAWTRRGQALAQRREWDRALADYTHSLELNAVWFETWSSRARARLTQGDLHGAAADATRALELEPKLGDALNTRGIAWSRLGRPAEAISDFSKAIELRPQYMEARINRAAERARSGDPDGALTDLDEAVRFDPQPAVYLRRAQVRGLKGDAEGAIADCTEAIRLDPKFLDAYVPRGVARMERGDRSGAAEDFARALDLAPAQWPGRPQVRQFLRDALAPK